MTEKQENILKKIIQRALAVLIAAAFIFIFADVIKNVIPKTSESPRTLTQLPNPSETVEAFFDAVVKNDFQKAASYTENYSSFGIDVMQYNDEEDALKKNLFEFVMSNYSYELVGECTAESKSAVQEVAFTYFDVEAITLKLGEYAQSIAYDRAYSGEVIDEKTANEILSEALASFSDTSEYMITKNFSVDLTYNGEVWLINLPAELLSAMVGIK